MLHNTLCKFIVMTVSWFLQSSCKVFDKRSNDERYEAIVEIKTMRLVLLRGVLCARVSDGDYVLQRGYYGTEKKYNERISIDA